MPNGGRVHIYGDMIHRDHISLGFLKVFFKLMQLCTEKLKWCKSC